MSAARHKFKSREPVDLFSEQLRHLIEKRGHDYHKVMPMPKAWVSDNLQIGDQWTAQLLQALPRLKRGISKEWRAPVKGWQQAYESLKSTKQKATEVYADNVNFWIALRKLAIQLSAMDYIVTPGEVMLWVVKDTVRGYAETAHDYAEAVQEGAAAVYDAGRSAVDTVTGAASTIPTIAKALAVTAVGLGVYAIAKRN